LDTLLAEYIPCIPTTPCLSGGAGTPSAFAE
jgi:hypothetical protein